MQDMVGKRAFVISLVLLVLLFLAAAASGGFVRTSGSRFEVDGQPLYCNGFNSYWLMYMATDPGTRDKVSSALEEASSHGLSVVRTWAFSDGGYRPLQISPGHYNEDTFKGLDFVIAEAKKYGVRVMLSLANQWDDFGGKKQYIQWARDRGQYISSDDGFFTNEIVKGYYKNHVKAVLTRVNTVTGVAYKDDPTIFAWELMNEPRCQSDLSGRTLQHWIVEMAAHVKSIDSNHLLEVGMEGFYGESKPERKAFNPGYEVGTDFISNHLAPGIDFATIHAYPDQWFSASDEQTQVAFLRNWMESRVEDAAAVLKKPLMFTEFGMSSRRSGYTVDKRNALYNTVYDAIYGSARAGGALAGGLFWQLIPEGMDGWRDGYEVILSDCSSTAGIISQQSTRVSQLDKFDTYVADAKKQLKKPME